MRLGGPRATALAAALPGTPAVALNPMIGTSIRRHFIITTDFAEGAVWLEPKQ